MDTSIIAYMEIQLRQTVSRLYVSADHLYFLTHKLTDIADEFAMEGGQQLFIDEIHKYENWSRELKQIYDTHPDLKVIFTGSSVLDIYKGQADLSRRAPIYMMQGLSFREYLILFHGIEVPVHTLSELIHNSLNIESLEHPVPLFRDYLKKGYYRIAAGG